MNALLEARIGIIGCGHLGRSLAKTFLAHGLDRSRLLLSHASNPATTAAVRQAGLEDRQASNEAIGARCDVVFLAVRPQDAGSLAGLAFRKDALTVSCMAGVGRARLNLLLGRSVVRIMTSGPDTMASGSAVAAVHPPEETVCSLLRAAGFRVFEQPEEEGMHVFTVGVCLPAALAVAGQTPDVDYAVSRLAAGYPMFTRLYDWAGQALPKFASDQDRDDYVAAMSTKGGVTEAIVTALRLGRGMLAALQDGMNRCRELERRDR